MTTPAIEALHEPRAIDLGALHQEIMAELRAAELRAAELRGQLNLIARLMYESQETRSGADLGEQDP